MQASGRARHLLGALLLGGSRRGLAFGRPVGSGTQNLVRGAPVLRCTCATCAGPANSSATHIATCALLSRREMCLLQKLGLQRAALRSINVVVLLIKASD